MTDEMPKRWARIAGFTLIEIAIVLVVVGLLLSGAMYGIKPVVDSSRTATTNGKLERIELALLAYVMQNGCLPCPADGDLATNSASGNAGWSRSDADYYGPNATNNRPCASPGGSACNATVGVVPWNTLGIREADMIEGWSSRITYAVTQSLTATTGSSMVRTAPASYPAGTLSVTNYDASNTQTSQAAYVLVSHGRDRAGAFSSGGATISSGTTYAVGNPQGANMPANNTGTTAFRQDAYRPTPGAGTYYDDIVLYRTAPNMIRDCGPNACGNPSG